VYVREKYQVEISTRYTTVETYDTGDMHMRLEEMLKRVSNLSYREPVSL